MLSRRSLVLVALLFLIGTFPSAAHPALERIAEVEATPNAISWVATVPYHEALLQISGPGGVRMERAFTPEESIRLGVDGDRHALLADGRYTYTLVLRDQDNARSQRGPFDIVKGEAVRPKNARALDQVFTDDLIVQASQCVGFDCADGESFGFDTVRLKENNLRIHFEDTSTSSSFPTNDWRITVNSSTDGGPSFFSIDDATDGIRPFTIEDGADEDAFVISDGGGSQNAGYIGLGTADPATEIHVSHGDTPTLRLEQDNSQGWGAFTWDVAGNETNFFVRDITNGSTLPFKIIPASPSDNLVVNGGNIGIGARNPSTTLHVQAADPGIRVENQTTGTDALLLDGDGNLVLSGVLTEASSADLKENRRAVDPAAVLETLSTLPLSTWNYTSDATSIRHMGPMAQDFYAAFGLGIGPEHIAPLDANGVAFAAIQGLAGASDEQADRIDVLEERVRRLDAETDALRHANQVLEDRVTRLEALVRAMQDAAQQSEE